MNVAEILAGFPRLAVLVVGDICLDRWCTYDPAEVETSRETGLDRLAVVRTVTTPGAGGTVAANLAALGAGRVAVLGAIADDGFGYELKQALEERGIESALLVRGAGIQTFTYTKLLNRETREEDRPRVDFINGLAMPADVQQEVERRLRKHLAEFDVIVISDQAETKTGGVVSAQVRQTIEELAVEHPEKIIWVDSRRRPEKFRRVIVKPNRDEAEAACLRLFGKTDYAALRHHTEAPLLLVTDGPNGVFVESESGRNWVRTRAVQTPVDICGAGDSFSAGASMALAISRSAVEAARFGNLTASITIMKKGTGTASPAEIEAAARCSDAETFRASPALSGYGE